jgi:hypothetical protein
MSLMGLLEKTSFEQGHYTDGIAHTFNEGMWIPADDLYGVVSASVTYSSGQLAAGGQENPAASSVETFRATAAAGVSAIVNCTVPFAGRVNAAAHGGVVIDTTWFYSITTAALSGQPTATAKLIAFPAVGVTAAAISATTLTVTKNPATFNLAVNTAGQYQSHQFQVAAGGSTVDLQKLVLRTTWPMLNTCVLDIAGVLVHYGAV